MDGAERSPGNQVFSGQALSVVLKQAGTCAYRTVRLLLRGELHLRRSFLNAEVELPDGRHFVVFRESTREGVAGLDEVTLVVWFSLRGFSARTRVRRFLFRNLCILNTLLFAGFEGYLVKLWMEDPRDGDYAGLYSWSSDELARVYARYITAVLKPFSKHGSVDYLVLPAVTLEQYLSEHQI